MTDHREASYAETLACLVGKVFLPDPYVFRQVQPGDSFIRPTGTTHALREIDLTGDPQEVVERMSHPDRLTACGVRFADLGEGCSTRARYLDTPSAVDDGYVMGGGIDCRECLKAMEVLGVR